MKGATLAAAALLVTTSPVMLAVATLPSAAQTSCSTAVTPAGYNGPAGGIPAPQGAGPFAQPGPIPADILAIYQQTGGGLWPLLAGIGWVETNHGATLAVSSAGAVGFMQFEPSTWAAYGQGGDPNDPKAAIPAAWRYLNAGGPLNSAAAIRAAIFSYNHSWTYVDDVLATADQYAKTYSDTPSSTSGQALPVANSGGGCDGATAPGSAVNTSAGPVSGSGCTDPLPGSTISQHFGHNGHPGVDLAGVAQRAVLSACPGTVVFAGPASGFGDNYVVVDIGGGIFLSYGHMNQMYVAVGAHVEAGTPLGLEGWEGFVIPAGPGGLHLHFQCQTGTIWGSVCNPETFLATHGVALS